MLGLSLKNCEFRLLCGGCNLGFRKAQPLAKASSGAGPSYGKDNPTKTYNRAWIKILFRISWHCTPTWSCMWCAHALLYFHHMVSANTRTVHEELALAVSRWCDGLIWFYHLHTSLFGLSAWFSYDRCLWLMLAVLFRQHYPHKYQLSLFGCFI